MKKTTTAAALLAVLLLAGCTPTTPSTPAAPGDSAGGDSTQPCVVGQWDLDVARYQDDVEFYASETGVPFEELAISGTQTLSFAADGQVSLGTSLTTNSTIAVAGFTSTTTSTNTNLGVGQWTANDDGTLTITDFSFSESTVSLSAPGAPEFGGCDFTAVPSVDVQCEADSLFLIGSDAPFGTYWTRR